MADPVENNPAPTEGGITGHGFKKGQSGNPGGRPKGLASKVRATIGSDGDALVSFWNGVLTGYVPLVGRNGEVTYEKVDVSDRIAVSKILAERGWGKPAQFLPVEDDDPLDLRDRAADELAAGLDARLDDRPLAERRREKTA